MSKENRLQIENNPKKNPNVLSLKDKKQTTATATTHDELSIFFFFFFLFNLKMN